MTKYRILLIALSPLLACSVATAAEDESRPPLEDQFEVAGTLATAKLDETSGMVAGNHDVFYMHNDDGGAWVYAIGAQGEYHGRFRILGAKNKDWEDIARVPGPDGPLLVVADSGDNKASRKDIELYFVKEPGKDALQGDHELVHKVNVKYADGPRDVESVAYEPSSKQLMFMSKRDQPPRLYALPLSEALEKEDVVAKFVTEIRGFRPPTRTDILKSPTRGLWVSQPTGLDFSSDGRAAAVITYRSLYVFTRNPGESWEQVFQRGQPQEYLGPPGLHDEAVAFDARSEYIYVTTEKLPAPIHRLPAPQPGDANQGN